MSSKDSKILIIETDQESAGQLEHFISNLGYEYLIVRDGATGLAQSGEWGPDLIIMDLFLSDMSGLELLQKLKADERSKEIPVILLSEDTSEEASVICLSNGASDFIYRPVSMGKLMTTVQNNLALFRSRKELKELNWKLQKEKKRLLKYFSYDIVEKILNEEITTELGGLKVKASILFFDIRGSTNIAEIMDPLKFAELISLIVGEVMTIVFECHGSVNKLLGDGILATFGCPVPHEDDAINSLNCAIRIKEFMHDFNMEKPDFVRSDVGFGIGVSMGMVFAGNVGSVRRMEYTVLGDPVNIAARLQSLTVGKEYDILIDENINTELAGRIDSEYLDEVHIRGKEIDTVVFALKGIRS